MWSAGWELCYRSVVKLGDFWSQFSASHVSSHTEELRYNETACLPMTIYTLPTTRRVSTLAKQSTFATCVTQSSSNQLSTSVSDKVKCNKTKVNKYTLNSQAAIWQSSNEKVWIKVWIKVRWLLILAWNVSYV